MQCHASRRFQEKPNPRDEFWDVVSTLTQDLTKARNQLARLVRLAKPGASLFDGDCGRVPLQPLRNSMQVLNCHRCPPPGHFGCGQEYPHYSTRRNPSPERRRRARRPVPVCGANSFRHSHWRAPSFGCRRSPQRPSWSFEQPKDRMYSCEEYSRAPETPYSCDRLEKRARSRPRDDSNCVRICINPDPPAAPRCRPECKPTPCRGGGCRPARIQGGGRSRDCIATQFASMLQDVTCQLRERRLAAAAAAAAEGRFHGGT